MLSQHEKFSAIRAEFPNIPRLDLARVAERIRTDSDLYRIGSIVCAYARHVRTAYDSFLSTIGAGSQYYGGMRQEARQIVSKEVSGVIKQWKRG